jgi:alginate O-acetyltransferase complex protein AlgI
MIFSSALFLVYFLPLILVLYLIIPNSLKNFFLLLASIIFYSWGAPKFIFVILATTTVDFYLVQLMANATKEKTRKLFLVLSLSLNLGLLFYFKYYNFFVDNFNHLFSLLNIGEIKWVKVLLPIGISFYTFESLTYVIDVYRKEHKPLSNFFQYQLYILFFPKLIAGPIVRFSEIADQITGRFATYNVDMILNGFCRFMIGLGKKVLIANVMATTADQAFSIPVNSLGTYECWVGALAYTFQIYFDFSGYSDMAIGLAKMFGFRLPENFNNPYTSQSITEFWRRWHMTLGNWMKNYLYIPLGGNKVNSKSRLYFNLWLVFILSGFWHGASWTFIFWGIYYGFWLVLERMFLLNYLKKIHLFSCIITFLIVVVGWVFFRSDSIGNAFAFVSHMFSHTESAVNHVFIGEKVKTIFAISLLFSFFTLLPYGQKIQNFIYGQENKSLIAHFSIVVLCLVIFTLSLASITSSNFNPFIYFRF